MLKFDLNPSFLGCITLFTKLILVFLPMATLAMPSTPLKEQGQPSSAKIIGYSVDGTNSRRDFQPQLQTRNFFKRKRLPINKSQTPAQIRSRYSYDQEHDMYDVVVHIHRHFHLNGYPPNYFEETRASTDNTGKDCKADGSTKTSEGTCMTMPNCIIKAGADAVNKVYAGTDNKVCSDLVCCFSDPIPTVG